MASSAERAIVEELEAAGQPLSRETLVTRIELPNQEVTEAVARLRGQEVIRKLSGDDETDRFRLTSWPDHTECASCGEPVTSGEHYELTLSPQGGTTDPPYSGTLHADCAQQFLATFSLSERE